MRSKYFSEISARVKARLRSIPIATLQVTPQITKSFGAPFK